MTNTPPPSDEDVPHAPSGPTPLDGPASPVEPTPLVEAVDPVPLVEPVETVDPVPLADSTPQVDTSGHPEAIPGTAGYEEHIVEAGPVADETAPVAPVPPVVQTVYVTPPAPPRARGNRGFGILFAVLGLLAFALLFVGAMALVLNALFPGETIDRIVGFIGSSAFIVPLAVYFVAFVLLVVIANRATWWAYVLGSFVVALVVYFGSIGVILLMANVFGMTPTAAAAGFVSLATSPAIIAAAVLSREVTIWFGAAIASRGRKVTARNLDARADYERELDNQPLGFA